MMGWGDHWPGAVLTVVTSVMVSNDGWWSHWSAVVPLSTIVSLDRLTVRLSRLEGARQMSIFVNMDPEQNLHKSIIQIMQCAADCSTVLHWPSCGHDPGQGGVGVNHITILPYNCTVISTAMCAITFITLLYHTTCLEVSSVLLQCMYISILHHIYTLAR